MSAGDIAVVAQSNAMIALLLGQVEELKRDKDELRADKEALKQENARLTDELQRSLAGEGTSSRAGGSPTHLSTENECSSATTVLPGKELAGPAAGEATVPRKRGRPRKAIAQDPPLPHGEDAAVSAPKKRGRPRKNVQTALIAAGPETVKQVATPAIKVDEAFVFTKQQSEVILRNTPAFVVTPEPGYTIASREFYHKTYEGSPYQTVQIVRPHKNPSGKTARIFLFPANDVNPYLPLNPGQPGFLIDNRYFRNSVPQPWSLFRKVTGKAQGLASTWLYLGEYEYTPAGKMSVEVFNAQSELVQTKWAEEVLSTKRSFGDIHLAMRARIALRKAGVITKTSSKADVDKRVAEELESIAAGNGRPVDEDDVVAAFSAGDEAIDITTLKCVSYDRILAEDIASKFALLGTPRKSPRGKAKRKASLSVGTSPIRQQAGTSTSAGIVANSPSSSRATRRLANMFTNPSNGAVGLSLRAGIPDASNGQADGEEEEEEEEAKLYDSEDEVASLSYP